MALLFSPRPQSRGGAVDSPLRSDGGAAGRHEETTTVTIVPKLMQVSGERRERREGGRRDGGRREGGRREERVRGEREVREEGVRAQSRRHHPAPCIKLEFHRPFYKTLLLIFLPSTFPPFFPPSPSSFFHIPSSFFLQLDDRYRTLINECCQNHATFRDAQKVRYRVKRFN